MLHQEIVSIAAAKSNIYANDLSLDLQVITEIGDMRAESFVNEQIQPFDIVRVGGEGQNGRDILLAHMVGFKEFGKTSVLEQIGIG